MNPMVLILFWVIKALILMAIVWVVARKHANLEFMNILYTIVIIGFIGSFGSILLFPSLGGFYLIPILLLSALVVMKFCYVPFGRSIIIILIYGAVLAFI